MGSLGLTCDQVKINFPVGLSHPFWFGVYLCIIKLCYIVAYNAHDLQSSAHNELSWKLSHGKGNINQSTWL
jgi:hypothetical protein